MQKSKNILSAIMCVCIMVFCLGIADIMPNVILRAEGESAVVTSGNWTDAGNYSTSLSGSGTEEDPFIVATAQDLAYIATLAYEKVTKYYKQTADIDLAEHFWTPITYGYLKYDGAGYTIKNMKISLLNGMDNYGTYTQGLGFVKCLEADSGIKGEIKNLNFENAEIIDERSADNDKEKCSGIVAGKSLGLIQNCSVQGTLDSVRVGGVVGYNATSEESGKTDIYGTIKNCSAKVKITAKTHAGGITSINHGVITDCKVWDSNIVGVYSVGGIAGTSGTTEDDNTTIRQHSSIVNSYVYTDSSASSVLADTPQSGAGATNKAGGGLVGYNYSEVSNCMSDGVLVGVKVTSNQFGATGINNAITNSGVNYVTNYAGGLIGYNDGAVTNVYSKTAEYDNACVVGEYAGGLIGWNGIEGTISNAYAVQRVWASYQGGVIGNNKNANACENVFYSTDVSDYNRGYKTEKDGENNDIQVPKTLNIVGTGTAITSGVTGKISFDLVYKNKSTSILFSKVVNGNTEWLSGWTGAIAGNNTYVYPILKFLVDDNKYANAGADNLEGKVPMPYDKFYSVTFMLGASNKPNNTSYITIDDFANKEYVDSVSHHIKIPTEEIYTKLGDANIKYKKEVVWYSGSYNGNKYEEGAEYSNNTTYKAFLKNVEYTIKYYLWNEDKQNYEEIDDYKDERLKYNANYVSGGADLKQTYTYESTGFNMPFLNYKDSTGYEKGLGVVWKIDENDDTVFDSSGSLRGKTIHNLNNTVFSTSADKKIKLYGKIQKALYSIQLNVNGYKDETFYSGGTSKVSGTFTIDGADSAATTIKLKDIVNYGSSFDLSVYNDNGTARSIGIKDITLGNVEWTFLGFGIYGTKTVITGPDMKNLEDKVWEYATSYTTFTKNYVYNTTNGETIIQLYAVYTTKIKTVKFYTTTDLDEKYTHLESNDLNIDFNTAISDYQLPSTTNNNFKIPTGMEFKNWFYVVDKQKVEFDITQPVMSNLELYADYGYKKYQITFEINKDGAETNFTDEVKIEYKSVIGEALFTQLFQDEAKREEWLPTKEGWICTGWYLDQECTKPVFLINGDDYEISADVKMPNEEETLYAGWRTKKFKLSLNANGGNAGSTSIIEIEYGKNIVDTLDGLSEDKLPTRVGMGLVAWSLDVNDKFDTVEKIMGTQNFIPIAGTEVNINGENITIGQIMPDIGAEGTILSVYAIWRNSCKVTMDTGSGKFTSENAVFDEKDANVLNFWIWEKVKDARDSNFKLSDYTPVLDGFLFKGWYTVDKTGKITETSQEFSEDYYFGSATELKVRAKWEIDPKADYIAPDNTQSIIITLICVGAIVIALAVSLYLHAKSKDGYVNEKQFQKIQSAKGRFSYNPHDKQAVEKRKQDMEDRINSREE